MSFDQTNKWIILDLDVFFYPWCQGIGLVLLRCLWKHDSSQLRINSRLIVLGIHLMITLLRILSNDWVLTTSLQACSMLELTKAHVDSKKSHGEVVKFPSFVIYNCITQFDDWSQKACLLVEDFARDHFISSFHTHPTFTISFFLSQTKPIFGGISL